MAVRAGQETQDDLLNPADPARLHELAEALQSAALDRGWSVATAESCTGGLVGHLITEIPGSSAYYRGGIVSYSDELKVELLGVPREAIQRHGAVSAQVALAMAQGACRRLGADAGVAVTGIAGPDGGSATKPVGLTYVAVAGPDGEEVRRHAWHGDRTSNKQDSAEAALRLLTERIVADTSLSGPR